MTEQVQDLRVLDLLAVPPRCESVCMPLSDGIRFRCNKAKGHIGDHVTHNSGLETTDDFNYNKVTIYVMWRNFSEPEDTVTIPF